MLYTERMINVLCIVHTDNGASGQTGKMPKADLKHCKTYMYLVACADPESFVRGGPTLTNVFFDEGREDPITTISGPPPEKSQ